MAEGLFIIELLNEIESVLAYEPVAVAAMPPLGEVDFVEGPPVEAGGKHGLDFGDGVEPFEDGVGLFAVVEAAIELLTDVVGEAGDFSGAHGLGVGSKVLSRIDRIMAGQNHFLVMRYQVIRSLGFRSRNRDGFSALVFILTFLGRRLGPLLYARAK